MNTVTRLYVVLCLLLACREKERCGRTGWWEKTLHVGWLESGERQLARQGFSVLTVSV
jgi:hypothetical protein